MSGQEKYKQKRGVKNIDEYCNLSAIVDLVLKAEPLPYIFEPWKQSRDRALLALLAASGMRISEALSVTVDQFDFGDPDFVFVNHVPILKRRKDLAWRDFPLPLEGVLAPLTNLVVQYWKTRKKGLLFDISRCRAWQIMVYMTGKWCHYFRSQRISYLVNKFGGVRAAEFQGIKRMDTISHYYKGGFRDNDVKKMLLEKE